MKNIIIFGLISIIMFFVGWGSYIQYDAQKQLCKKYLGNRHQYVYCMNSAKFVVGDS